MTLPHGPRRHWSLNFAPDGLADDRSFRVLVIVDDLTRANAWRSWPARRYRNGASCVVWTASSRGAAGR
jgi:hypothetical protein